MKTNSTKLYKRLFIAVAISLLISSVCFSQNDVMMQTFYWDVPVDAAHLNGYWWDTLNSKIPELKASGIKALWLPSPCKGNWGIIDNGYGIYDPYDLGAYNQKGSVETRFGSKAELLNLINTCHQSPKIDVFADIVMNHNYGDWGLNEESNPAVKAYVFGEAHNGANVAYQTGDIHWVIPNATAGDYYIQIKGYNVNWSGALDSRGYDLNINWTNASWTDPGIWESEPNNGSGQTNNYPGSGITVRGHADYQGDIDEYKVTLTSTATIQIQLIAMQGTGSGSTWQWVTADQTNGYYPINIWYNGSNIASTKLEAHTPTKSVFPTHTGAGEANFQWGYADFHPSDANDWMGDAGYQDALIPNTRWFGNDFNTYSANVQSKQNAWGQWMVNTIGFDGFRLDFVRGYQVDFIANWISSLPKIGGTQQRYIVGEYWSSYTYRLKNWINDNAGHTPPATVSVFDFPLKFNAINAMCNGNGSSFNMSNLNHAGMVRDNTGNNVPGVNVCTFAENHDTGKDHNNWIFKDWALGYAYIITHEGRPCIFYPHFYGVRQVDVNDGSFTTQAPASLKNDIKKLIFARNTYLGGTLTVLSEVGNPYPAADAANVYVARRGGNGTKSGAIIVLNNNDTQTKGLWVTTNPTGWSSWANLWIKNAFNPSERLQIQADGRVFVQAQPRGFAIYVLDTEYVPYTLKSAIATESKAKEILSGYNQLTLSAYPNPAVGTANISINLPKQLDVEIAIYNTNGQLVTNLYKGSLPAGQKIFQWNFKNLKADVYICKVVTNNQVKIAKVLVK